MMKGVSPKTLNDASYFLQCRAALFHLACYVHTLAHLLRRVKVAPKAGRAGSSASTSRACTHRLVLCRGQVRAAKVRPKRALKPEAMQEEVTGAGNEQAGRGVCSGGPCGLYASSCGTAAYSCCMR